MVQLQQQAVEVWKHSCEKCGSNTTIFVTNPSEQVMAFCCNRWVSPDDDKKPAQPATAPVSYFGTRLKSKPATAKGFTSVQRFEGK